MTTEPSPDLRRVAEHIASRLENEPRADGEAGILKLISLFIKKFYGNDAVETYDNFVREEEFNELELINDEFANKDWRTDECSILEAIAEGCNWDETKKDEFYLEMRDFLGIELKPSSKQLSLLEPKDMQWGAITADQTQNAEKTLIKLCFDRLSAGQDGGLMRVYAHGVQNRVNLVPLLYDIYHRYRIEQRTKSRDKNNNFNGYIMQSPKSFFDRSTFFHRLSNQPNSPVKDIVDCLQSFGTRLLPSFTVNRNMTVIHDVCTEYIAYANIVGQILNENRDLRPLQVDLVIIPKKRGSCTSSSMNSFGGADDDSSDEDEDDNKNSDSEVVSIQKLLKKSAEPIDVLQSMVNPTNAKPDILKHFMATLNGEKSLRRVVIVIDRRFDGDSELLVFRQPKFISEIPENFTIENMIFASANYIFPQLKNQKFWDGGKNDTIRVTSNSRQIPLFVLSYECLSNKNRLQWFCNGQGIRVFPKQFGTLWAHCFDDQQLDEMKTRDFDADFGLDCTDQQFETWYGVLTETI
jgi:hypothetical protein